MEDEGLAPGRSVDIELGGQEVITIDLDNLDPNPEDVLDLLKEGQCKVWVWTKLAGEYWRRGYLEAAERIAKAAVESFEANGSTSTLPPIYALLANIQIAYARQAPKVILEDARQDNMAGERPKDDYYKEAAQYLNASARSGADSSNSLSDMLQFLTRGIQQLATRSMDDALRSFNSILTEKPTNLIALLGKARIEYAKRLYPAALKTFQSVLRLNPHCNPDPRIGIGLCLWSMGHQARARAAWQRSLELNPSEWAAELLLGLDGINTSKNEQLPERERKQAFIGGTKLLEKAFKANQKSAAAANALCDILLQKNNYKRALKLAERTIQFADTLTVLTEGYLRAARVSHADDSIEHATKFYAKAKDGQPNNLLASIGLAQMQIKNDEIAAAIHTLDTLLQPPNPQKSHEATVMLASLRAHPRPGVDLTQERTRARELFERSMKGFELDVLRPQATHTRGYRAVMEDMELHIEIAKLWQEENVERVDKSLKEALRIGQAAGKLDPRLLNNIGALRHMEGDLVEARRMYETSLTNVATLGQEVADGASTTFLYNLSRVYEDQGEDAMAKDAYEKLLSHHPEYIDAKIRLAHILSFENRHNDAHELLKQALSSQSSNLNLRAFYINFLVQSNLPKPAKDFVFGTLKDLDRHDTYALCAAGWILYQQARESRDPNPKSLEERKKNFQRAADFYDKALKRDPHCAVAAQGIAIVVAEDALGALSGTAPMGSGLEEVQRRMLNARDALDVFAKVRESISDGSVYFNMGHCYYARDEFDRAIESYETASTRFYHGQNVSVLLCLCRSWYAKATKDQSFTAMNSALRYAQKALHIQPNDKAILYNIGMIQQKSAEMLFAIPLAKRSLKDLKRAIEQAAHAQKLFASLAADRSPMVPYSREIADQRRKYGDSMLRKGDEHLESQRQFEAEAQAKLDAARAKRQEEKERQEALERARMEELRKEADKLAEERRIARERAQEWTREVKMESDEERERKAKKVRKVKPEGGSGDEGGEPKKKRRGGKLKRTHEVQEGEEPDAVFSDDEDGEKPSKKRSTKKRVIRDDDEEATAGPRKKQFKSKEMLSDTDEEME